MKRGGLGGGVQQNQVQLLDPEMSRNTGGKKKLHKQRIAEPLFSLVYKNRAKGGKKSGADRKNQKGGKYR